MAANSWVTCLLQYLTYLLRFTHWVKSVNQTIRVRNTGSTESPQSAVFPMSLLPFCDSTNSPVHLAVASQRTNRTRDSWFSMKIIKSLTEVIQEPSSPSAPHSKWTQLKCTASKYTNVNVHFPHTDHSKHVPSHYPSNLNLDSGTPFRPLIQHGNRR